MRSLTSTSPTAPRSSGCCSRFQRLHGDELIVGRVTDDVHPNKANEYRTVWNDRLEVISSEKFYKLSGHRDDEPFYGTEDEAKAATEKRFSRYANRDTYRKPEDITAKAAPIVKRYIHEQFGVRRVKMEDIKVTKHKGVVTVTYHKHVAQLH